MILVLALMLQDPGVSSGYEGGFFVRDGERKLILEGVVQVNAAAFERNSPYETEFVLRRMRLEFSGEFFNRWLFHIEPNFSQDDVELEEAWGGMQFGAHRLMIGRMKEPFSLEEMNSVRHMDMLNFSILNQFVPAEDHGITILGRFHDVEYGFGFYTGTGGDDTTSDKDVALRLVIHAWEGLQVGTSATFGREKIDVAGEELRTEARVPWAEYVEGAGIDGNRARGGLEAAFLEGPWAATAEWMRIREVINGSSVTIAGGYVQASWVLTGEDKTWRGVSPAQPFLKDPGAGAWQLVARWSVVHLDDDLAPFLTTFPGRIDSITFGLNWYANDFVKVKLNALRTLYDEDISVEGRTHDRMDSLLFQFQVQF